MPGSNAHTERWLYSYISCYSGLICLPVNQSWGMCKLHRLSIHFFFFLKKKKLLKTPVSCKNFFNTVLLFQIILHSSMITWWTVLDMQARILFLLECSFTSLRNSYFSIDMFPADTLRSTPSPYMVSSQVVGILNFIFVRPSRTYLPLTFMLKWLGGRLDRFS